MSTTHDTRRHHGPVTGDPALRSLPPPGSALPSRRDYRRPPIQMPGCLSTYDYLCHDYACCLWPNCPHGGNRD